MVKEGYKQTDIGLIPDDWQIKTMADISSKIGDIDHRMPSSVLIGIPYIMTGDFIGSNGLDFNNSKQISEKDYIKLSRKIKPEFQNIIFARYASVGATRFVLTDRKFLVSYSCAIIQLTDDVCKKYVYYFMSGSLFKKQVDVAINTGTQKNIGIESLSKFNVALPPISEQILIATALSDMDDLIFSLEKLISKKQAIKQGVMQELLAGKKRLEGFSGEWNYKKFSETFDMLPNNTYSRNNMNDVTGQIRNVHYGDVLIKYNSILDCKKEKIPYLNDSAAIRNKKSYIMDGDLIIADTAEDDTVGKAVEIINTDGSSVVSGLHTMLCRPKAPEFSLKWLGYFINSSVYHNQLLPYITGIKVSSISKSNIADTIISIPSKEEQTAITSILSDMDTEIEKLQEKLEKYRAIKQGMMSELLTGRIRLKEGES